MSRDERRENKASADPQHSGRKSCEAPGTVVDPCKTVASESDFECWLMATLERKRAAIFQSERIQLW